MSNLAAIYGEKIFHRKKAYKKAEYIPLIGSIVIDFALAYGIVEIFEIKWNYAFIKIFGLLLLYRLALQILAWVIDKLNYKLFLRAAMVSEMEHYLRVFNMEMGDSIGVYEDYLLSVALDESQGSKMQVLAAMLYGGVMSTIENHPKSEGFYFNAWCEAAPKYIKNRR